MPSVPGGRAFTSFGQILARQPALWTGQLQGNSWVPGDAGEETAWAAVPLHRARAEAQAGHTATGAGLQQSPSTSHALHPPTPALLWSCLAVGPQRDAVSRNTATPAGTTKPAEPDPLSRPCGSVGRNHLKLQWVGKDFKGSSEACGHTVSQTRNPGVLAPASPCCSPVG